MNFIDDDLFEEICNNLSNPLIHLATLFEFKLIHFDLL